MTEKNGWIEKTGFMGTEEVDTEGGLIRHGD